jgi:DNA-directed RNA polymerase specialized sigma24 family protein
LLPVGGGEDEDVARPPAESANDDPADELLVGLVPARLRPRRPASEMSSATFPVVPLLPIGEPIDAAGEAWLTARAGEARAGDRAALEALVRALGPRIDGWVARCIARSRPTPRRDGHPWLADDLRQEAWFALERTLEAWPGEGSFLPWLLKVMPFRLADRWQVLIGPEPRGEPAPPPFIDDSFAASETWLLLEALAERLEDHRDRLLLLGHVGGDLPLARFVGEAGDTPGAVYGRWRRLLVWLRTELAAEREVAVGDNSGQTGSAAALPMRGGKGAV